ncbi:hypothetical protein C240_2661 [Enterococcus sp. 5H]|nr:hypothetical protein [Enterococcus sp. 5H]
MQEELKETEFQEYIKKYPKLGKIAQPVGVDFQALSVEIGHAATINQDNREIEEIIDW